MVQLLSFGLCGLVFAAQAAFALPEALEPRAISKVTMSYTTTKTLTAGAGGQRTRTVTETLPTIIRTRVKKTKSTKTPSTSTDTSTSTSTSTKTTGAGNPDATPGTCDSVGSGNYVDKNGVFYTVSCGTDYYGGDLDRETGQSFEDCFDLCDAATGCVAFSWVGQGAAHAGPGDCYLKDTLKGGVANSNVDGAYVAQS